VLLGGIAVVLRSTVSALLMAMLVATAGVFHGYAYGESIIGAETSPLLSYLFGFSIIQYAIIATGIKLLEFVADRSEPLQKIAVRFGGVAATLAGVVFFGQSVA
jgi:urease accessory protein